MQNHKEVDKWHGYQDNIPQHIIVALAGPCTSQRGNNREPCFYAEDDYYRYLDNLFEAAEKNQAEIHAYVLMTNHVHLLVTPLHKHSITHMMQDLGRKYVRYINHTYKRTGTLWEGRFKSCLIDSDAYLLTCMRYIETNPVRAKMVKHPSEYCWSSYAFNATGKSNKLIKPHVLYFGLSNEVEQRQYVYRELFSSDLHKDDIHAVRDALNHQLVLGRDDFKDKIEVMTNRQTRLKPLGRHRVEEDEALYDTF